MSPGSGFLTFSFILCASVANLSCGPPARSAASSQDDALEAFRRGELDRAEALLAPATDIVSLQVRARLLMLRNRGREAVDALEQALAVRRTAMEIYPELAEAFVRVDNFTQASRTLQLLGDTPAAKKYEELARNTGYLTVGRLEEARPELVATDPVPLVRMSVNGRDGLFVVDTGEGEIVLDPDFARRAGVRAVQFRTDAFRRSFDDAVLEEIGLGALHMRNVPAQLQKRAPQAGFRADGAIGLSLLMHFDFTLDLKRGRLTLRPPGSLAAGLPALWGGDRNLLARARLNGTEDAFVAIQTGLANVAVAASPRLGRPPAEVSLGPLRLASPKIDTASFPAGLDTAYGFPVTLVLGADALRGRSLRVDPQSMRLVLE